MRDINEVIRRKEAELQQLQRDIEALRVAQRLLAEEDGGTAYPQRPATTSAYTPGARTASPSVIDAGYGASWDAAAKKFP